jgi:hypothetical protein
MPESPLSYLLADRTSPYRAALEPINLELIARQRRQEAARKAQDPFNIPSVPNPLDIPFSEAVAEGAAPYFEDYGVAPETASKLGKVFSEATQLSPAVSIPSALVSAASTENPETIWSVTQNLMSNINPLGRLQKLADLAGGGEVTPTPAADVLAPATQLGQAIAAQQGRGTVGVKSELPLEGGRISQRYPRPSKIPGKGWEGKENPLTENLLINMDVLRQDPVKMQHAADIIATYPNTTRQMLEMGPEERVTALRDQATENLLALYDMMPPAERARASRWYYGANRIANERAAEVGIHPYAAAGTYAGLSPQKDWFQNVYLGDQTLRILAHDPKLTTEMLRKAMTMPAYQKDPMAMEMLRSLEGRSLGAMEPFEQAMMVRLFEETYGPVGGRGPEDRMFRKITPEGEYGEPVLTSKGVPELPAWGSFTEISKAIRAARSGGDPNMISPLMGGAHKVRNFYNDIVNPALAETFGDITADTHEIAGSLFRPLSATTTEVSHGLGSSPAPGIRGAPESAVTGLAGLYPVYADAARIAAARRNTPVIAMQSVPWEAARSLFTDALKKIPSKTAAIDDIWRSHGRGEITAEEARRRIVDVAGGFKPPTW